MENKLISLNPNGCLINKQIIITINTENYKNYTNLLVSFTFTNDNTNIFIRPILINEDSVIFKCPKCNNPQICLISLKLNENEYTNSLQFIYSELPFITKIFPLYLPSNNDLSINIFMKDINNNYNMIIRFMNDNGKYYFSKPNKIEGNLIECKVPNELEGKVIISVSVDNINYSKSNENTCIKLFSIIKYF